MSEEQIEMFEKKKKQGGKRENAGRKKAWQETTKVTRLPISIIEKINGLKAENIDIKDVLDALEKVKKPRWSKKLINKAKELNENISGAELWNLLKAEGFEDLPSKNHMKRWIATNLIT